MPLAGQCAQVSKSGAQEQAADGLTVASAAHELRNPVDAMINVVSLLKQAPNLNPQIRDYVQRLENELQHMQHIITEILGGFHRSASATLVSLPDILDTILRFYSEKIAFKRIGIDKRYECEGVVIGNAEDLRQVFSNLVVNALEALRLNGRLTIHISQSRCWSNTELAGVRISIADNGSGILAEHRDKIMSEHFLTTKGNKGTGLGLWLSADLVGKQGGSIRFRSSTKSGHSGTVFSVFLPTPAVKPKIAA
jgi:signal transduction histidine kinase